MNILFTYKNPIIENYYIKIHHVLYNNFNTPFKTVPLENKSFTTQDFFESHFQ